MVTVKQITSFEIKTILKKTHVIDLFIFPRIFAIIWVFKRGNDHSCVGFFTVSKSDEQR